VGVRRVFVAGTIQGTNAGFVIEDQSYRGAIREAVAEVFPNAHCFDPSAEVTLQLRDPSVMTAVSVAVNSVAEVLDCDELGPEITRLRRIFREMTHEVTQCDLCIAYLPGRMPSMGTAMEMYAAHTAHVPVFAITHMTDNLAIMSVATVIVPEINLLADALLRWRAASE
jgi:nucleoside 2-deoxyribosyltransferase